MPHKLKLAADLNRILLKKDLQALESMLHDAKLMNFDPLIRAAEDEILYRMLLKQESDHIYRHNTTNKGEN